MNFILHILHTKAKENDPLKKTRTLWDKVPWRRVIGLRNVGVHEYFAVGWGKRSLSRVR